MHRRWLAGLRFDQPIHHIVLEECIAAVEGATARRNRLEARWCMKTRILAVIPASQWHMERAKAGLAILMPER